MVDVKPLKGMDCFIDLVEAVPSVIVFPLASDQVEAFQDIDDVVNSASLNSEKLCDFVEGNVRFTGIEEHLQKLAA